VVSDAGEISIGWQKTGAELTSSSFGPESKLHLHRSGGMLLGPEDGEQVGDPDMDGSQAVEAGVAGRADRDQEPWLAHAGPAMVDMKDTGVACPTALAPILVPIEDRFPVSAEVIPRVPAHAITLRAEAGDRRDAFTAGAKERLLPGAGLYPNPQGRVLDAGDR
jgi:hypothetical protein